MMKPLSQGRKTLFCAERLSQIVKCKGNDSFRGGVCRLSGFRIVLPDSFERIMDISTTTHIKTPHLSERLPDSTRVGGLCGLS